jgi:hypothetical protein
VNDVERQGVHVAEGQICEVYIFLRVVWLVNGVDRLHLRCHVEVGRLDTFTYSRLVLSAFT